jgi:hypothetical protein
MANREQYPQEQPRKKAKKEPVEEIPEEFNLDNIVNLGDEIPRLFEVRSGMRRDLSTEGNKSTLLDKNVTTTIDKICAEYELERRGAIQEIMESALKEFYSRIFEKVNSLQSRFPDNLLVNSNVPKEELKRSNKEIIHNQRKVCENPGSIKESDVLKLLGLGRWKLRSLPGN